MAEDGDEGEDEEGGDQYDGEAGGTPRNNDSLARVASKGNYNAVPHILTMESGKDSVDVNMA